MISHRLHESTALTISLKVHLTTMAEGESDCHDMHMKKSSMSNVITAIQTKTSVREDSFRASDYIYPSKLHILWILVIRRCKDFFLCAGSIAPSLQLRYFLSVPWRYS
jgi:hypothetical protein